MLVSLNHLQNCLIAFFDGCCWARRADRRSALLGDTGPFGTLPARRRFVGGDLVMLTAGLGTSASFSSLTDRVSV